jgi:superoxide dismutase, Fe-Mn family
LDDHYPFELIPLPYEYDALEPYIDTETMELHHNKHLKTYVDHLNAALKEYPQYHCWSLEELIRNSDRLPGSICTAVKNNAGGVYNHNFYFNIMGNQNNEPTGTILSRILSCFGTFENFKADFKQAALDRFGSGYAWLACDRAGRLKIVSTANQDTVLPACLHPILLMDVWEHAYYLKYKNRRTDYIDNWFHVIDWKKVETHLNMRS